MACEEVEIKVCCLSGLTPSVWSEREQTLYGRASLCELRVVRVVCGCERERKNKGRDVRRGREVRRGIYSDDSTKRKII